LTPYTYLVVNKITGMFYYGARYSKKSTPNDLWNTYFTSSRLVKQDIDRYGKHSFHLEIRRTFDSVEACLQCERRGLSRLNAKNHQDCYNLTNGGAIFNASKNMTLRNPMRDSDSVLRMVETKKRLKVEGRHRKAAPNTEAGIKVLSEKMLAEKNPMKNPTVAAKMARTKQERGNTTADTRWVCHPILKVRRRVKIAGLQYYLDNGWMLGVKFNIDDLAEACQ